MRLRSAYLLQGGAHPGEANLPDFPRRRSILRVTPVTPLLRCWPSVTLPCSRAVPPPSPTHGLGILSHRRGHRVASRFFWDSALSGRCALMTPNSPDRYRSGRLSARCQSLSRSLRSRLPQHKLSRRTAILPRRRRVPPSASRILSAPARHYSRETCCWLICMLKSHGLQSQCRLA